MECSSAMTVQGFKHGARALVLYLKALPLFIALVSLQLGSLCKPARMAFSDFPPFYQNSGCGMLSSRVVVILTLGKIPVGSACVNLPTPVTGK